MITHITIIDNQDYGDIVVTVDYIKDLATFRFKINDVVVKEIKSFLNYDDIDEVIVRLLLKYKIDMAVKLSKQNELGKI